MFLEISNDMNIMVCRMLNNYDIRSNKVYVRSTDIQVNHFSSILT